jgi:hypothetical protein
VGAMFLFIVGYTLFILPLLMYHWEPKLKQQYRLIFSEAGIVFQRAGIDASLEWSIYREWWADCDFYALYHGKRELAVIPRRASSDDSVDQGFRELLGRKIGDAGT